MLKLQPIFTVLCPQETTSAAFPLLELPNKYIPKHMPVSHEGNISHQDHISHQMYFSYQYISHIMAISLTRVTSTYTLLPVAHISGKLEMVEGVGGGGGG